jgi:hypothetical protein
VRCGSEGAFRGFNNEVNLTACAAYGQTLMEGR